MAKILTITSNTNAPVFLENLKDSPNIFIAYQASILLGEQLYKKKQFQKSYVVLKKAYQIDLSLNRHYNGLYKIFGRYYRSKNRYLLFSTLRHFDPQKANSIVLNFLKSAPSKSNPYLKKISYQLKNKTFNDFDMNYHLAKHLFVFNNHDKTIPVLLQNAITHSYTKKKLSRSLTLLVKFYLRNNREKANKIADKYLSTFLGNSFYDELLYDKALVNYYNKNEERLQNYLNTILSNSIKNKSVENKAIGLYYRYFSKNKQNQKILNLFNQQKKRIKNSNILSDRFFLFSLNTFYSTNKSLFVSITTNLSDSPKYNYFSALGFFHKKEYLKAYSLFSKIIQNNSSHYYTILSLEGIKNIYQKNKHIKHTNLKKAKQILKTLDLSQKTIPQLSKQYRKILSLNPNFTISRKKVKYIIKNNKSLKKKLKKKPKDFNKIRFYTDHFMRDAVKIEILQLKKLNLSTCLELSAFFSDRQCPKLSIHYAQKAASLSGINLPLYMIKSPLGHYLYPKPYSKLIHKMIKQNKLNENFVYALIRTESLFNYKALSTAGASGLMQIMPSTFTYVAKKKKIPYSSVDNDIFKPKINIKVGTSLLKDLYAQFKHPFYVAAGYNAGGRNAKRWLNATKVDDPLFFTENITYKETENYIKKIYYAKKCYEVLY